MSTGMFPVLDSQPEFLRSTHNAGKDLVDQSEALTKIAETLGVRPLMDFYSLSRADAAGEFGGEAGVQDIEERGELRDGRWYFQGGYLWSVEQEWFSAAEGLETVTALRKHVEVNPTALGEDAEEEEVVEEEEAVESVVLALKDIEELLQDAEKKRRRFHMMLH